MCAVALALLLFWTAYPGVLAQGSDYIPRVGYLALTPDLTPEDDAAVRWLSSNPKFSSTVLVLDSLNAGGTLRGLDGVGVLWIHIPDSADFQRWKPRLTKLKPLKAWFDSGGRFLFTDLAAMIPHAIGIEKTKPAIEAMDVEDDWLFDQKGFQAFRPRIEYDHGYHPLFDGLYGGTFTWDGDSNQRLWCAGYFGDEYPSAGKVVAVEKSYITISADRRLVVEYDNRKGRGIAAGGFIFFGRTNHRRQTLEKFIDNALAYLAAGEVRAEYRYWKPSDQAPQDIEPSPMKHYYTSSGLLIRRDTATRNFFDLAGRSVVVMGKENAGIDEIWTHPFRLLRDYRVGIIGGDSVLWLSSLSPSIEVRPESFTRTYATPYGPLREELFVSDADPAAVARYEFSGAGKLRLLVAFRTDLRLMWPYDSPATGSVRQGYDSTTGMFFVSDEFGPSGGAFGADALPALSLSGRYDSVWWDGTGLSGRPSSSNEVSHGAVYELGSASARGLTIGIAGRTKELGELALARVLNAPDNVLYGQVRRYHELLEQTTTIESPDPEFNDLFKWALVGTDRFKVTTPGVGTGLLAGYSTTARGWDGGQKVSGRPGYAWYFGRDAEWAGFAIADYGDLYTVHQEVEFLQRYQDVSGKIFHEISTSGSVHYDAADATPLYVVLAARLFRAWGDSNFVRKNWAHLRRAMDYLYSTDTDGDGLIENTNEGHGWVEGGKLYPVHTEFYLAGAWCRALLDAADMASHIGEAALAEKYRRDGERVREILNRDFWNPETGFFNFGKMADGTYNPEPTVLPATVMYYGLLDDEKAERVLEQYAGSGFTSDWGVRIVSSSSPLFNPQGYHYGSVWPLFTGWTALAEYEYGRPTQGFTHILNNLYIKNHWALGFVEEVMNGALYQPSGVCPHQCWSETNILHPAITGMVGWKPDAPSHSAGLYPRFPVHWDRVKVKNLRVGTAHIDAEMVRDGNRTVWTLSNLPFDTTTVVRFAPEVPEGMTVTSMTLDGRKIPVPAGRRRGLIDPPIEIRPRMRGATLVIEHTGGIGVVPAMPRPEPGDSSTGHRIVSEGMRGGVYEVKVEGRAGSTAEIVLRTFDRGIDRLENASIVGREGEGRYRVNVEFPPAATPYVAVTVRARTR